MRGLPLNSAHAKAHIMIKAKKPLATGMHRIQLVYPPHSAKPSEPSLLLQRLKEIDREFAEQARQLAKLTKKFSKKITDKL